MTVRTRLRTAACCSRRRTFDISAGFQLWAARFRAVLRVSRAMRGDGVVFAGVAALSDCSVEAIAAMDTGPTADGMTIIGRLASGGTRALLRASRAADGGDADRRRGSV